MKTGVVIHYKRFIEWMKNKGQDFAFMLNEPCCGCGHVSQVVIKHRFYFYCGICWNLYVDFNEPIER